MARYLSKHRAKCLTLFMNTAFVSIISLTAHLCSSNSDYNFLTQFINRRPNSIPNSFQILQDADIGCTQLHILDNDQSKCSYVKTHSGCSAGGYISYLPLFYCTFRPLLGSAALLLWLLLLFYLLGDTAATYFCSSLEGLSRVLNLSPALAGVTLLSLGNGAPDLFSSIVSFMGNTDEVGLNSILGGDFFVSSTVVGIISLCAAASSRRGRITAAAVDKSSFFRDVFFFLLSLLSLLVIIFLGKINLWGAMSFLSLYFIYVFLVYSSEFCNNSKERSEGEKPISRSPVLALGDEGNDHIVLNCGFPNEDPELGAPLLCFTVDEKKPVPITQGEEKLGGKCWCFLSSESSSLVCLFLGKLVWILELPLYLPRRLTIPVISEEKWSKPFAVISVTVAPILLAVIWSPYGPNLVIYTVGGSIGILLGGFAIFNTVGSHPPRKWLFPWLAGGFLMSITWTYILAEELVSFLVSLGLVLGISPSILGLTVLAWGNSLGDLVANVSMARCGGGGGGGGDGSGGGDDGVGVQVAISACYAGPIFNTVVGLGLSLVFSTWRVYPSYYLLPTDTSVYETVGFLVGGLLWALVVLPNNNMRLSKFLGVGLLAIYLCFLSLKVGRTLGLLEFHVSLPHIMT
ncbi:hypothetical protein U1Q18_032392 [Sarracenia purpurea var. burkii]